MQALAGDYRSVMLVIGDIPRLDWHIWVHMGPVVIGLAQMCWAECPPGISPGTVSGALTFQDV